MTIPAAPPLRFSSLLQRAALWSLLTWGCALPFIVALWSRALPGAKTGMLVGTAVWQAMLIVWAWQVGPERIRIDRRLRTGASIVLVLHLIAVAVSPQYLFTAYVPALVIASGLGVLHHTSTMVGSVMLTILCGAQALSLTWLVAWVLARRSAVHETASS